MIYSSISRPRISSKKTGIIWTKKGIFSGRTRPCKWTIYSSSINLLRSTKLKRSSKTTILSHLKFSSRDTIKKSLLITWTSKRPGAGRWARKRRSLGRETWSNLLKEEIKSKGSRIMEEYKECSRMRWDRNCYFWIILSKKVTQKMMSIIDQVQELGR